VRPAIIAQDETGRAVGVPHETVVRGLVHIVNVEYSNLSPARAQIQTRWTPMDGKLLSTYLYQYYQEHHGLD